MRWGTRLLVAGAALLCGCTGPREHFERIQIGRPVPDIRQAWSRSEGSCENVATVCDANGLVKGKFLLTYSALGAPKRLFDGPPAPGTVRPELCRSLPLVLTCRFRGVIAVGDPEDIAGSLLREGPPPLGFASGTPDAPEPRLQLLDSESGQKVGVISLHESPRTGLWADLRELSGGRWYLEGLIYTQWPTDQGPLAQELATRWLTGVGNTEHGGVNPHDLETLQRAMALLRDMPVAARAALAGGDTNAEILYVLMYSLVRFVPVFEQ